MFRYFLPTLLRTFGYSVRDALLLCAPPFGFGTITAFTVAYWSDRTNLRSPFIVAQALVTLVGWLMILYCHQSAVSESVRHAA